MAAHRRRRQPVQLQGRTVIFSLVADPYAGYGFDDRHWNTRIGFWYRRASDDSAPWTYGGHLFPDGVSPGDAEWSGSTRIFEGGKIRTFCTATSRSATPDAARIMSTEGQIHADRDGVRFTGFKKHNVLLEPDGKWYQTQAQNPFFSFRDPFTFTDPAHPGKTFMVFEGNSAGRRGEHQCTREHLGDSGEDPDVVTQSGANLQVANIGLAVAENADLTKWRFLPPILSANCVNDQAERPQFVIKEVNGQYKYYLFTISHAFTYAAGLRGPDGVYGFVGDGIRSDFQPLNGSGLALGNPARERGTRKGAPLLLGTSADGEHELALRAAGLAEFMRAGGLRRRQRVRDVDAQRVVVARAWRSPRGRRRRARQGSR